MVSDEVVGFKPQVGQKLPEQLFHRHKVKDAFQNEPGTEVSTSLQGHWKGALHSWSSFLHCLSQRLKLKPMPQIVALAIGL